MIPPTPFFIKDLFYELDAKLIELLKSLNSADWEKQTIVPRWKVKDIAAHLLDGNIRSISILRDNYFGEKPENINTYPDLVGYLNELNADWVKAMKRVSPALLTTLLEITGKTYNDCLQSLNPFEKAVFSVDWAGEKESENWFHVAREYTEKWHHQQQIRLAVGQEEVLYARKFYLPYLNTSMRALPHHYQNILAEEESLIKFSVSGIGGGDWFLYRNNNSWNLLAETAIKPVCEVEIPDYIAWRIFTKGITRQEAEKKVKISGMTALGSKIFEVIAIMA